MPVRVKCGDPAFDSVPNWARDWIAAASMQGAPGNPAPGAVRAGTSAAVSLRDYAQALEGAIYFEPAAATALDIFLDSPRPDGSYYGSFEPINDEAAGDHDFDDEIRALRFAREPLDAQLESLAVLAAGRIWQVQGDTAWLQGRLNALQRGLEYLFTHPRRWSPECQMPIRRFTLDEWPVAFRPGAENAHPINNQPLWCIHPGDAALLFAACREMAILCEAVGQGDAALWRRRALHLEAQTNSLAWNGRFFVHQLHLVATPETGIDEALQLAACNSLLMTSGLAAREQCVAILNEYQQRRDGDGANGRLEWASIDPPFLQDTFGVTPGSFANGGVWPRVGAAIALAAFSNGHENYAVDILRRIHLLTRSLCKLYPCYGGTDGTPQRESDRALPWGNSAHDGPGAGALMRTLVEGLVGITDCGSRFSRIMLAPRWPATGVAAAEVEVSYANCPSYVNYRWALDGGRMTLDYDSRAENIDFHIMLPRGNTPERVALNGRSLAYALVTVEKSKYVALSTDRKRGTVAITLK